MKLEVPKADGGGRQKISMTPRAMHGCYSANAAINGWRALCLLRASCGPSRYFQKGDIRSRPYYYAYADRQN